MKSFFELEPREQLNDLVERELVEDVCGDGSFLIYKPSAHLAKQWSTTGLSAVSRNGQVLRYADLVLARRPRGWEDPEPCQPWSHTILKSRQGSWLWDEWFDNLGYQSNFHHAKIDGRNLDRVNLSDRSLRALKVLMQ